MNRVYIIIINWNGWRDTVECLASLLLLNYPDFRIIVCDNGSTDESLQEIRKWAVYQQVTFVEYVHDKGQAGASQGGEQLLTLISIDENLGFAGGNNAGLRYAMARGDAAYYWLLNNDTVVEPDAVTHLVARMQQQPTIGICGSTILMYHDRQRVQALGGGHYCRWIGLPWHYGRFTRWKKRASQERAESWMNYVEGASMLVSRRFLEEIGLLCEDYFLYFEEADWAIRANGRFSLGYAQQSIVYHKLGGSAGTSSNPAKKSYTCDYYNIRNRLLFTRRFYPAAIPTVSLVIVGAFLLRLCLGKWSRALMIFRILCGSGNRHHNVVSEFTAKP